MRLTALEPVASSGGVRLELDGAPFATVAAADVAELTLKVGSELSEARQAQVAGRAEVFAARTMALGMLARRAHPRRELERRLVRKGHPAQAVAAALASLAETGLLDDAAFAEHYARTRSRRRLGARRLVADLRRLGVAESEARGAVNTALSQDGVDPRALALEAAARKARSLASLDTATARRRLRAWLMRRGFDAADVAAVVNEALAG